jgi:two-component system nitrate/nitrite response regulator NarL
MKKIKILIAEDHRIVREGLVFCLQEYPQVKIIGEASNGKEAVDKSLELKPDVILMDFAMPVMNGLEATRILSKKLPKSKVLVLSAHHEKEYISEFIKSGAKGYVLKDISSERIIEAIKAVDSGDIYLGDEVKNAILNDCINFEKKADEAVPVLTKREIEVLKLLTEGLVNKEIAERMSLSVKTINYHRERIVKKVKIRSVAGLTKYAVEKKIIELNSP